MLKSTSVEDKTTIESELTREQALIRLAISDYVMLTKPRIILLLLVVTFVPMFLAGPAAPSGWLILWTMVGGFLAAGGANALNQFCLLYTSQMLGGAIMWVWTSEMMIAVAIIMLGVIAYQEKQRKQKADLSTRPAALHHPEPRMKAAGS